MTNFRNNRRTFLKAVFAVPTIWSISSVVSRRQPPLSTHLFIKESGSQPSIVGIIYCDSPKKVEVLIQKLRVKHKYRSHIMYRSRDKFKRPISLALIDLFFQEPSLRFYGRIIQKITDTSQKYLSQIEQSTYNATYRRAIVDISGLANSKSLKMNFYSSQETLLNELTKYARSRSIILADEGLGNNLIQLSDLFTGSIYGELFGKPINPTKTAITDYLKKRLGISDLKQLRNLKGNKFLLAGI